MSVSDSSKEQLEKELVGRLTREIKVRLKNVSLGCAMGTEGSSLPPFVPALFKIDTMDITINALREVLKELEDEFERINSTT